MQAVILAAGRGSRLGRLDYPKAMSPLSNGEAILERQVRLLRKYLPSVAIHVVVGYRKERIMAAFQEVSIVENLHYAAQNTAKSLLKGIEKIEDDVLWLNGDVVFDPSVLDDLLREKRCAMLVNQSIVGEEEVKYCCGPRGNISEVSKEVPDSQAKGEALGINFMEKGRLSLFKDALYQCAENDYFEKGLQVCIDAGLEIWPVIVSSDLCIEVDFPEDLVRAGKMAEAWDRVGRG